MKVAVEQGADVEEGALVCVIEAMKMENEITAHKAGKVAELPIAVGASVATGDTLAVINSAADSSDGRRLRAGRRHPAAAAAAREATFAGPAPSGQAMPASRTA